ncbi:hypothetical protein JD292_00735 [Leucobacter sp. CSA2]|uniref:DUF3558 domain-containing protein n=1 Tax=Leucobacter edaphi TaxID=2796472 RepID=A0A934UW55_9MICO|nr:hypothetical protein [Leucobacter edaphi]MBK0420605.1 hypothetical protein [Leucobacter edaphi]
MISRIHVLTPALAAVAAGLLLAGCAAEPSTPTGTPTDAPGTEVATTEPVESPASETTAEPQAGTSPITFPECDAANPLAIQESAEFYASWGEGLTVTNGPADRGVFNHLAGPSAQAALESAATVRGCRWYLYIHGNNVTQYTAELGEAARETLIRSLRDSDYTESRLGASTVFSYQTDDPENYRMTGPTQIQYIFIENAWIAIFETGKSDYSQSALDTLVASNPGLTG